MMLLVFPFQSLYFLFLYFALSYWLGAPKRWRIKAAIVDIRSWDRFQEKSFPHLIIIKYVFSNFLYIPILRNGYVRNGYSQIQNICHKGFWYSFLPRSPATMKSKKKHFYLLQMFFPSSENPKRWDDPEGGARALVTTPESESFLLFLASKEFFPAVEFDQLFCIYWDDHILSSFLMWWNNWLILNFKNKDEGAGRAGQLRRAWERSPPGAPWLWRPGKPAFGWGVFAGEYPFSLPGVAVSLVALLGPNTS